MSRALDVHASAAKMVADRRDQLAVIFGEADAEQIGDDVTSAAAYFDELDQLLADVRTAHSLMARSLGERMRVDHVDRLDRDGAPPLLLNVNKNRNSWQNEELRAKVTSQLRALAMTDEERLAVNPSTGERVPTFEQAIDGLGFVFSLSGSNVKVGRITKAGVRSGLRGIDIDPDDYSEGGAERPTYTAAVVRS